MAETALGVIGLLGLFSAAVDCFEYVRIAKTFERDFATSQLRLDGAQIRLTRWGAALGIQAGLHVELSKRDYEHAEKVLKHLELLFNQAKSKSEIFAQPGVQIYETAQLEPPESLVHQGYVEKIRKRMKREPQVGKFEKGKWAVYEKKELDDLIDIIVKLVDQLEGILPMSVKDTPVLRTSTGHEQVQNSSSEPEQRLATSIERPPTLQSLVEEEFEEVQQVARVHHGEVTPLQIAETMYEAAQGTDPHLEDFLRETISKLYPDGAPATTTYNINQKMGDVKDNKGIVTAVNHGNQTNHYGST